MEASLEVAYQVKRKVRQRLQTILNALPSIKNTTKNHDNLSFPDFVNAPPKLKMVF